MFKTFNKRVEQYFADVHSTLRFMKSSSEPLKKKIILIDTAKCMGIMAVFFFGWNFSKGKTHYLKYMSVSLLGMTFGLSYSFYFTSKKI